MLKLLFLIILFILFIPYIGYYILMINNANKREDITADNNVYSPTISLIVPTYNEEKTILQKLKNIVEQNYKNFKLIIIDAASHDRTIFLTEGFLKNKNIDFKIIQEEERKGKASSLNDAFKHCKEEIIVITDSDSIWKKDALCNIVKNFSDENIGAASGRQILFNPDQSMSTKSEEVYGSYYHLLRMGESNIDSTPIFRGELSAYRKDLIERISEDSMADDSELALKIRKKGYRTISDATAVFYEFTPPDFRSKFIQKMRRGQGLIQLFWRERGMIFNRDLGMFGSVIFPFEFFMHIISPILFMSCLIFSIYYLLIFNIYIFTLFIFALLSLLFAPKIKNSIISKILFTFLSYQTILFFSLLNHLIGRTQEQWKQIQTTRKLFSEFDISQSY